MEKPIRVSLLGRDYVLRVREQDEALTRSMVAYVTAKVKAFQEAHPDQSDHTTAVITAPSGIPAVARLYPPMLT